MKSGNYGLSFFWNELPGRVVAAFTVQLGGGVREPDGRLGYVSWIKNVHDDRKRAGQPFVMFICSPERPMTLDGRVDDVVAAGGKPEAWLTGEMRELWAGMIAAGVTPDLVMFDSEYEDHARWEAPVIRALHDTFRKAYPAVPCGFWFEWTLPGVGLACPSDYLWGFGYQKRSRRLAFACNNVIEAGKKGLPVFGFAGSRVVAGRGVSVEELEDWYTHLLVLTGGPIGLFDQTSEGGDEGKESREALARVGDRLDGLYNGVAWRRKIKGGNADSDPKAVTSVAELLDGSHIVCRTRYYTKDADETVSDGRGNVLTVPGGGRGTWLGRYFDGKLIVTA